MLRTPPFDTGNTADLAMPGGTLRKYLAHEFVAMSDSELHRYLEQSYRECGERTIFLKGPENVPPIFTQRLRDFVQRMAAEANPDVVDFDKVCSKLEELPSDYDPAERFTSVPSSPCTLTPPPPDLFPRRDFEALVQAGGRPAYDMEIVIDVVENPGKYMDLLLPWQNDPFIDIPEPNVFREQLSSLKLFRGAWQVLNRISGLRSHSRAPSFNVFVQTFRCEPLTYTESMRNLLAHYGINEPFQLQDDQNHQTKVDTWIEYIGFLCATHYELNLKVKKLKAASHEAWKKFIDSVVTEPLDAEEYGFILEYSIQRGKETFSTYGAGSQVEEALKAVVQAEDRSQTSGQGNKELYARIRKAQEILGKAVEDEACCGRRASLWKDFDRSYDAHQTFRRARKASKLQMKWALEQLPLVAEENTKSSLHEDEPNGTNDVSVRRDEATDTKVQAMSEIHNDTGGASTSGIHGQLSPNGLSPKRAREEAVDAASDDTRLPTPKRRRSKNAANAVETKPAKAPQTSRVLRSRRVDQQGDPETRKPCPVPRGKGVPSPSQPSALTPCLRRSARIAARNARKGKP